MTAAYHAPMTGTSVIVNVDDNETARSKRTRILREAGFVVYDAGSGEDTLAKVAAHQPDLVLLDVHLPAIRGIEVCRWLKSSPANAPVLVLQISPPATSAPEAITAFNSGADSYLVEPVDPAVLIATVRGLLRLRAAERELADANAALREVNLQFERLNKELQRSNDDLQQFAFVASHDLREPLRTVRTFVQVIQTTLQDRFTDEERKCFSYVINAADRMDRLIDDVLSYSQVGHNHRDKHAAMDLGYAVYSATESLKESILESKAELVISPLPRIKGDASQLGNVFQNLISNAINYRSKDRPVKIEIHAVEVADGGSWMVSVRDNGIGIEERYHEQIFKPFKRLHGQSIPGTGIGLALCRRVIEMHEGRIWLESTPGAGSEFFFTLPAARIESA